MDSKFFRKTTTPNYYAESVEDKMPSSTITRPSLPTMDTRFPYRAAQMTDGRFITDYRSRCSENIPTGSQYATKNWMIHNTDSIISISRERQAIYTGAIYGTVNSVPPFEASVKCTPTGCSYTESSSDMNAIGIERDDRSPDLFGTFAFIHKKMKPSAKTQLTTHFEGGRNSPRG